MRLDLARFLVTALVCLACSPPSEEGDDVQPPASKEEVAAAVDSGKADWSLDACAANGWYGDGHCDWFCPARDPDCNAPPLGPEPRGSTTRYPIVLAHGFNASPTNEWGFYGVAEALQADGHRVFSTTVPPYNSPAVRAAALARQVDEVLAKTGAAKVNLVAHSAGGLDARYLVTRLGYGNRVASVTTISTPHRGTLVADVALKLAPGAFDKALNALAKAYGTTYSKMASDTEVRAALQALSEAGSAAFNRDVQDDGRVYYQSWAGVSSVLGVANEKKEAAACEGKRLVHPGTVDKMDARLVLNAPIVAHGSDLRPNDGMATVESAKWGHFRGCIPADHFDEVGQVKDEAADPNTGFDHVRFYRNLAFDLAARGD